MQHIRINDDGVVVEVFSEGNPEDFFHPDISKMFFEAPDEVVVGWIQKAGVIQAPPIAAPVSEVVTEIKPTTLSISPPDFKLRFTFHERISLKKARATDPGVDDFYDILDDPRLKTVELSAPATIASITYFAEQGYLTQERATQVLDCSTDGHGVSIPVAIF